MASSSRKSHNLAFRLWIVVLDVKIVPKKQNSLANKSVVSVLTLQLSEDLPKSQRQEEIEIKSRWKIRQFMEKILYHPWYGWCQFIQPKCRKTCSTSE